MKCNNCGTELAEGAKFCGFCGAAMQVPVEQPYAEPEYIETPATETSEVTEMPKKASPLAVIGAKIKPLTEKAMPIVEKCKPFVLKNKLWFAGGACLLVLLITALIIVSACTSGNGFTPVKHSINVLLNSDKEVVILYDNKAAISTGIEVERINKDDEDEYVYIDDTQSSIDGSICAFLTSDHKLGVVNGKKATVIAEDVVDFTVSVNGKGIAYVSYDAEEETAELYLYNVSKKKSVSIQSDYAYSTEKWNPNYAVSPDGKSVAYYKFDEDDSSYTLMYFNGSKSSKVTSNEVELIGLSNKGKYIYAVVTNEEGEHTLYSYNTKGDKQKIGDCSTSTFRFNEDHTQVLYYDGSKTMISTKAKEPVKISSNYATILLPKSSGYHYIRITTISNSTFEYQSPIVSIRTSDVYTIPCDTLYNKVYACEKDGQTSAWLIKKNTDKSVRLVNNIGNYTLDESCEYLYYTDKDSNLMMLKVSQGERASDKAKQIAEDVDTYVVTSDRSKVYFTSDDALYSCNGKNGKSKKTVAAENVHDYIVLNANDVCFYIMEGDAYATNNGKKGKMVVADVDSVAYGNYVDYELEVTANGIVYIEADGSIYASKTNKKPTKIYSE